MIKENYYNSPAISNSHLRVVEIEYLGYKPERFRGSSESRDLGDITHKVVSGEIKISELHIRPYPPLTGKKIDAWHKVMNGMSVESAVNDTYEKGIDKIIEELEALYKQWIEDKDLYPDGINISAERLKYTSSKLTDEEFLELVNDAYCKICEFINIKHNGASLIHEKEIYFEYNGVSCKAKPDLIVEHPLIGSPSELMLLYALYDFKIGSGEIYKKIRDRRYIRQLSFYTEALRHIGIEVSNWV
ncbi:MAG: hypothetical protein ACRCXN_00315, partial [Bacteroidales bacterium]